MATNKLDINRRHPIYNAMVLHWRFWWDAFLGSFYYVKHMSESDELQTKRLSYLVPNDKEFGLKGAFAKRNNRSFLINHSADVIKRIIKYIFSGENKPSRVYKPQYEFYIDNADLLFNNRDAFQSQTLLDGLVQGQAIVMIDKTSDIRPEEMQELSLESKVFTRSDAKTFGMRSYWRHISIFDRLDWEETNGIYDWLMLRNISIKSTPWEDRGATTTYIVYTPETIFEYNERGKLIKDYKNPMGVVPFFNFTPMDSNYDGIPESYISGLAPIDKEIYNTISLYVQEMRNTSFPWLAAQMGSLGNMKEMFSGPQNILQYTGDKIPGYLEPAGGSFDNKLAYVDYLLKEFMRVSSMDKADADVGADASGLSKLITFQDTDAFISEKAQKLETFENMLSKATMLNDGLPEDTVESIGVITFDGIFRLPC